MEASLARIEQKLDDILSLIKKNASAMRSVSSFGSMHSTSPPSPRGLLNLNPVHDVRVERQRRYDDSAAAARTCWTVRDS